MRKILLYSRSMLKGRKSNKVNFSAWKCFPNSCMNTTVKNYYVTMMRQNWILFCEPSVIRKHERGFFFFFAVWTPFWVKWLPLFVNDFAVSKILYFFSVIRNEKVPSERPVCIDFFFLSALTPILQVAPEEKKSRQRLDSLLLPRNATELPGVIFASAHDFVVAYTFSYR